MQRLYSKPLVNANTINMSIIGMNGSGKSAVVVKYLTRRFIVEYAPYLSDSYTKSDLVDGQELTINIQDTSDSDEIDLDDIIRWSQVVIILFSMTSRRSFYRAQELVESIKNQCNMSTHHHGPSSASIHYSQSFGPNSSVHQPHSTTSTSSTITTTLAGNSTSSTTLIPTNSFRRSALSTINAIRPPNLLFVANKLDLERFRLVEKSEAQMFAHHHSIPYFEITVAESYSFVQTLFHSAARSYLQSKIQSKSRQSGNPCSSAVRGLTTNTAGSVLNSLAVAPGLLLQKKAHDQGGSGITPTADIEFSSLTMGAVNLLSNLKLRSSSTGNKPATPSNTTTATNSLTTSSLSTVDSNATPPATTPTIVTISQSTVNTTHSKSPTTSNWLPSPFQSSKSPSPTISPSSVSVTDPCGIAQTTTNATCLIPNLSNMQIRKSSTLSTKVVQNLTNLTNLTTNKLTGSSQNLNLISSNKTSSSLSAAAATSQSSNATMCQSTSDVNLNKHTEAPTPSSQPPPAPSTVKKLGFKFFSKKK